MLFCCRRNNGGFNTNRHRWNAAVAHFSGYSDKYKLFITQYKSLDDKHRLSLIHDVLIPIFSSNLHLMRKNDINCHRDRNGINAEDVLDAKTLLFSLTQCNVLTIRRDLKLMMKSYYDSRQLNNYDIRSIDTRPPKSLLVDMDEYFKNWLRIAYNHDNLSMRKLTSNNECVLNAIMATERIHRSSSTEDLKTRITSDSNRRTYGLFHISAPDQLLSYVHVGFTNQLAVSMRCLDDYRSTGQDSYTHAMLYSVHNCLSSLSGLELSSFLIHRLVEDLRITIPSLHTFSTLSPVSALVPWLLSIDQLMMIDLISTSLPTSYQLTDLSFIPKPHLKSLLSALQHIRTKHGHDHGLIIDSTTTTTTTISCGINPSSSILSNDDEFIDIESFRLLLSFLCKYPQINWLSDQILNNYIKEPMLWLTCKYITSKNEVGNSDLTVNSLQDQASQFHFRNGAELYKINWQANVESEGSMKSSLGIMVNYVYQLDRLEQNARNYALDSRQYVLSDEVRQCMLLR